MRNFNKRFADIRKGIRKGNSEDSLDLLGELQKDIKEKMDRYVTMIEAKSKTCRNKAFWSLVREEAVTRSMIKLDPVEGVIRLKVANKASEKVERDLVELSMKLLEVDNIPAVTLKGKVHYIKALDTYTCTLYSGSKKFKTTIEYSPEEEK